MDIMRTLKRYWALLCHSPGLAGKIDALPAGGVLTNDQLIVILLIVLILVLLL